MADEQAAEASDEKGKPSVLPWIVVGIISAAAGSAVPLLMPTSDPAEAEPIVEVKKPVFELPKEEETVFVTFGDPKKDQDITVNLNESRMTRFLLVAITLQIPKSQELEFPKLLETKKAQLRSWLLSEMADMELDDVRGAAGMNRLRRTIREHFNSVLYPDGTDMIYDVLFDKYNVQ
ncbi:MAG: flagellar basal body-associated FliL family protein [Planctomycetaceae bacterium]|nr:flagellar basal body-associated FliL family protein [Planctomycetaceae bacterium]